MLLSEPNITLPVESAAQACQSLGAILDAIDALVYVTDMDTHEIIFINKYGRDIWGNVTGQRCWSVLQNGQEGPCEFCTNAQLVDENGQPSSVVVWEFQNTVNKRWYQCRDQAIPWINGKLARIEIATDITDLKNSVQALKMAKQEAEALSRTDELTGINNRRALFEDATMLLNLSRRYATPLTVALLDMDHFKQINDTFGHAAGDQVLKRVASEIRRNIRDVDLFARLGGEEFVLVLPGVQPAEAEHMLERLRTQIGRLWFPDLAGARVSMSIGMAVYHTDHDSFQALLNDADMALYQAKAGGRNRLAKASPRSA